jgi:glycosyltransferase involved in cell wall biosynthesis
VITGLGVGGAELQLWTQLRHSRHHAEVVTLYNKGPVAGMLEADGVPVTDLGMTRNTQLSALPRLRRLIRSGGYDVVHTHLYRSQIYGRIAARLAGTPVVLTTEHSIGETHLERRRMTFGVRGLYLASEFCSQATIAVSDTVRDRLVRWGVPEPRIRVIPNGVDFDRVAFDPQVRVRTRRELGIPDDAHVTGVLGRLDPNKRFDLVIEAVAPLLAQPGDIPHAGHWSGRRRPRRLLVVGKGDHGEHLEKVAAEHGVTDRVVFTGERHDVAAMLSAMDLFVAASVQETFGLSVLEALANGLPALYTTCPALRGVPTGLARRVDGTAFALRAGIARDLRRDPGPRTPDEEVRTRYGIEAVARQVDDLYEELYAMSRSRVAQRADGRVAMGDAMPRPSDLEA